MLSVSIKQNQEIRKSTPSVPIEGGAGLFPYENSLSKNKTFVVTPYVQGGLRESEAGVQQLRHLHMFQTPSNPTSNPRCTKG